MLSVASTLVSINIKSKSVQMFDALHNLCVYKDSLFSTAPTMLLHLAPAKNDALTPVVQSKIKIYHLSNSIAGFVVHSLSASSQQLASF